MRGYEISTWINSLAMAQNKEEMIPDNNSGCRDEKILPHMDGELVHDGEFSLPSLVTHHQVGSALNI